MPDYRYQILSGNIYRTLILYAFPIFISFDYSIVTYVWRDVTWASNVIPNLPTTGCLYNILFRLMEKEAHVSTLL